MAKVEGWWNQALKRYDPQLEVIWRPKLDRFVVIRHNRHSTDTLWVVQDSDGGFLTPHPNLIIWGDKEIKFQGIHEMDFWHSGHKKEVDFVKNLEEKRENKKKYKKKKLFEYIGDKAGEL